MIMVSTYTQKQCTVIVTLCGGLSCPRDHWGDHAFLLAALGVCLPAGWVLQPQLSTTGRSCEYALNRQLDWSLWLTPGSQAAAGRLQQQNFKSNGHENVDALVLLSHLWNIKATYKLSSGLNCSLDGAKTPFPVFTHWSPSFFYLSQNMYSCPQCVTLLTH